MIRVWIVEDNARFRDAVAQVVNESDGMRCDHVFASCEALLENLRKGSPPEVILLDIRLHGMSGLEAIAAVKAQTPNSQVIMLTMFDDQDRIFRALCSGASGYLLKTSQKSNPAAIPAAILEAVHGGVPLSAPIARSVLNLFARLGPTAIELGLGRTISPILLLLLILILISSVRARSGSRARSRHVCGFIANSMAVRLGPVSGDHHLTQRESAILELKVQGLIKKEITERLQLSFHTVDGHLRRIYQKLHVNNGPSAVAKAVRERLL